jgi:hypothetical protein
MSFRENWREFRKSANVRNTLHNPLTRYTRITAPFNCPDGHMMHVRKLIQPETEQGQTYHALARIRNLLAFGRP